MTRAQRKQSKHCILRYTSIEINIKEKTTRLLDSKIIAKLATGKHNTHINIRLLA